MELNRKLFRDYFNSSMSQGELVKRIDFNDKFIKNELKQKFYEAKLDRDSEMIEYLIYTLLLWNNLENNKLDNPLTYFIEDLNELLISLWHEQHENIVMLIQVVKADSSVEYLYNAINLHPSYLAWDENLAFEVKCIWALGAIGTPNAVEKLNLLSLSENEIISSNANRQIVRINQKNN